MEKLDLVMPLPTKYILIFQQPLGLANRKLMRDLTKNLMQAMIIIANKHIQHP